MNSTQIESLESYLKTDNDHFNEFALKILCETIQDGQYEDTELPLKLFSHAIEIFTEHHKQPVKAVQKLAAEVGTQNLTDQQQHFIYYWILKYLRDSDFEGMDMKPIEQVLNSHRKKLNKEAQVVKPLVKDIREALKELMQKEVGQLSQTLKELEPVQRLNILCRLMPFVLPKMESIEASEGEVNRL